jgi:hypothetical protein
MIQGFLWPPRSRAASYGIISWKYFDTVERLLQIQPGAKRVALEEDQKDGTADHGVHLWQQGGLGYMR